MKPKVSLNQPVCLQADRVLIRQCGSGSGSCSGSVSASETLRYQVPWLTLKLKAKAGCSERKGKERKGKERKGAKGRSPHSTKYLR